MQTSTLPNFTYTGRIGQNTMSGFNTGLNIALSYQQMKALNKSKSNKDFDSFISETDAYLQNRPKHLFNREGYKEFKINQNYEDTQFDLSNDTDMFSGTMFKKPKQSKVFNVL